MELRKEINNISKQILKLKKDSGYPIYEVDLLDSNLVLPSMIKVVKEHLIKKYPDAIGLIVEKEGIKQLQITSDHLRLLDVKFYPDINGLTYYQHPVKKDYFIDATEYKKYIKAAQVTELQVYAKQLGASYCKITYKSKKTIEEADPNKRTDLLMKNKEITTTINIKEAEIYFDPTDQISAPQLQFFAGNKELETLSQMRLEGSQINSMNMILTYDLSPYMPLWSKPNRIKWEFDITF